MDHNGKIQTSTEVNDVLSSHYFCMCTVSLGTIPWSVQTAM